MGAMMSPNFYDSFKRSILDGELDLRGMECQAHLGFRHTGEVLEGTAKDIGILLMEITSDGFMFDWPAGLYEWVAEEECDSVVITAGETRVAYFYLGFIFRAETVTFRLHGDLQAKKLDQDGQLTLWERLRVAIGKALNGEEHGTD